jgi:hypothetical protein
MAYQRGLCRIQKPWLEYKKCDFLNESDEAVKL